MADDRDSRDTPAADDVDERTDQIARVVTDYLREGESFLVRHEEGETIVEEAQHTRLQRAHPRLYGRLLSLEDQLETGCMLTVVLFAIGGLFCLGLQASWWDAWLDPNVTGHLKTWWFYAPFFGALFFLSDWIYTRIARRIYRQGRAELLAMMREEGFDRDSLVTQIKDMEEFTKITAQLKLDRGPFAND